jgi:hypothetical protein
MFACITKTLYPCCVIKKANMKWSELKRIAEQHG